MPAPAAVVRRHFGVFAKEPVPGRVKTRLAVHTGAAAAAKFHELSLQLILRRFANTGDTRTIGWAATTASGSDWFARQAEDHWITWPQPDGDLGQRMQAWFAHAFADGATAAVLIGSDSPTLPTSRVQQAFAALNDADCVLVPADDGGYCLLGLRAPQSAIFDGIAWSTCNVLAQSVQNARAAGLTVCLLDSWADVDTVDELPGLLNDLNHWNDAASSAQATALKRHVEQLLQSRRN